MLISFTWPHYVKQVDNILSFHETAQTYKKIGEDEIGAKSKKANSQRCFVNETRITMEASKYGFQLKN